MVENEIFSYFLVTYNLGPESRMCLSENIWSWSEVLRHYNDTKRDLFVTTLEGFEVVHLLIFKRNQQGHVNLEGDG